MPLYLCMCPDAPGALDKRAELRDAHKTLSLESRAKGTTVLGRALMSPEYTHAEGRNPTYDGTGVHPGFVGSVLIYRFDNIEDAWARLRRDPFYTGGVWDQQRVSVTELDPSDVDATVAFK